MDRGWKNLSIVAGIFVAIGVFFSVYLSYQLGITQNELDATLIDLDSTKTQLRETTTKLNNVEKQLDDTEMQLSVTEGKLEDINNQLTVAINQLEAKKNENNQMLSNYTDLREQINIRLGDNQQDMQSFITPDNSVVSTKVKEITGGFSEDVNEHWADYQRLYTWVVSNIKYSYDSYTPYLPETISGKLVWQAECWRTPEETIKDNTGDCEDMATLLDSMMINYNEGKYGVWLIFIRSTSPEARGHVAVALPVKGGNLSILDPAGNYYTGYRYGRLQSLSSSAGVKDWLSHWKSKMPDARIVRVVSNTLYEEFSSTDEFLKWLQDRR